MFDTYEQYRNRPRGWGSEAVNRPSWQTSQQQWAKDIRDEKAMQRLYQAEQASKGKSPEQRTIEAGKAYQDIADQGGGRSISAGSQWGPRTQAALSQYAATKDYFGDIAEKGKQRQAAEEDRAYERDVREYNKSLLEQAKKQMRGMGSMGRMGGSYKTTGV